MTDIDHMIAVMQAAKEGKAIQSRPRPHRVKPAEPRRVWLNWYPTMNCRALVCYDSREEAKSFARHEVSEQIEFVEVVK